MILAVTVKCCTLAGRKKRKNGLSAFFPSLVKKAIASCSSYHLIATRLIMFLFPILPFSGGKTPHALFPFSLPELAIRPCPGHAAHYSPSYGCRPATCEFSPAAFPAIASFTARIFRCV